MHKYSLKQQIWTCIFGILLMKRHILVFFYDYKEFDIVLLKNALSSCQQIWWLPFVVSKAVINYFSNVSIQCLQFFIL